jgi:hypothetical protein
VSWAENTGVKKKKVVFHVGLETRSMDTKKAAF